MSARSHRHSTGWHESESSEVPRGVEIGRRPFKVALLRPTADHQTMETAPSLRPGAFAGTAEAYLRYRPPYPAALLDDLIMRARLPFRPVLLDLACGPGRVSLALAAGVDRVLALDLEPEMVRVGAVEAARRDVTNVTWLAGRAEEANLEPESVDVITIGEAFHRLDQNAVITNALNWLKPGGCIVTLGTRGLLAGGEGWMDGHSRDDRAAAAPGRSSGGAAGARRRRLRPLQIRLSAPASSTSRHTRFLSLGSGRSRTSWVTCGRRLSVLNRRWGRTLSSLNRTFAARSRGKGRFGSDYRPATLWLEGQLFALRIGSRAGTPTSDRRSGDAATPSSPAP